MNLVGNGGRRLLGTVPGGWQSWQFVYHRGEFIIRIFLSSFSWRQAYFWNLLFRVFGYALFLDGQNIWEKIRIRFIFLTTREHQLIILLDFFLQIVRAISKNA